MEPRYIIRLRRTSEDLDKFTICRLFPIFQKPYRVKNTALRKQGGSFIVFVVLNNTFIP
jgi:hypothetical protein